MATLVDLADWLQDLTTKVELRQSDLAQAAENQKNRIITRTTQGVDVAGQSFASYRPLTHKEPPVTLGSLTQHIQIDGNDNETRISIQGDKGKISRFHNEGTRKMAQRRFFGTSLEDVQEILADVRKSVFQRLF